MSFSTTKRPIPSTFSSPFTYAATITRSAEMPALTNVFEPLNS